MGHLALMFLGMAFYRLPLLLIYSTIIELGSGSTVTSPADAAPPFIFITTASTTKTPTTTAPVAMSPICHDLSPSYASSDVELPEATGTQGWKSFQGSG